MKGIKVSAQDHINRSAALRAKGDYFLAALEIENNRDKFDDVSILPALLQAFYAAKEAGDRSEAENYAREIAAHDPEVPSIQDFL